MYKIVLHKTDFKESAMFDKILLEIGYQDKDIDRMNAVIIKAIDGAGLTLSEGCRFILNEDYKQDGNL